MFAVHVENLIKCYGERSILDKVSLDIEAGQFYALMGPNGSGKTTLASIIASYTGIVEIQIGRQRASLDRGAL
jgi:ABC-type multidrug transport system ATPase subunit